ncbi:Hypothetical_protein [Hexamita inflata]|uniref:Hypothetical_protein n=1 Tax=Hexamita inflata TaxID=28002 RepID=A0AA86V1Y3_9EUKA|nr:Hypothetical protein HINF_LOCUS42618 [Hexamita inflata]
MPEEVISQYPSYASVDTDVDETIVLEKSPSKPKLKLNLAQSKLQSKSLVNQNQLSINVGSLKIDKSELEKFQQMQTKMGEMLNKLAMYELNEEERKIQLQKRHEIISQSLLKSKIVGVNRKQQHQELLK